MALQVEPSTGAPSPPLGTEAPAGSGADGLTAVVDAVWETLQVTNPQGVEPATLAAIAAQVGVSVEALLSEDPELLPNLASVLPAGRAATPPAERAGDAAALALLISAPHTDQGGATSLGETFRSALHNLNVN